MKNVPNQQSQETIIVVDDNQYVYEQIKIVSTHAPLVTVVLKDIGGLTNATKGDSVPDNDSVIRTVQRHKRIRILSGKNALINLLANGQKEASVRMVTVPFLERCAVPPKKLSQDELMNSLLTKNSRFNITIKPKKQARAVSEALSGA